MDSRYLNAIDMLPLLIEQKIITIFIYPVNIYTLKLFYLLIFRWFIHEYDIKF